MSLSEFLAEDNTDEINALFEQLVSFRVDTYVNLRARFNFITEVVNLRYPNGLPCHPYTNDIIVNRDSVLIDDDPPDEECRAFLKCASEVETFIFKRDETFHRLQEIYLKDLLAKSDMQFRLALSEYRLYKEAVDYRWPKNLTVYNKIRMAVDERVLGVLQFPLSFASLGYRQSRFE